MNSGTEAQDAHILVVDDDERIRTLLQKFLARNGYWVSVARDAAHARRLLEGLDFDILVLDVMMPGEDGFSLTRDLRRHLTTPILLLTAKGEASDRIRGLEAGADDYLPKPFEPRELLLRINAILRRSPKGEAVREPPRNLHMGEVRYDLARGELWNGNSLIRMTTTEAALMRVFAGRVGETVSRQDLKADAGADDSPAQARAIDVQITRLRKKIEADPRAPRYLQTVRGSGYVLAPD
jgi:two-component system, OmpR family, phosphate regulon response regulator OmpR